MEKEAARENIGYSSDLTFSVASFWSLSVSSATLSSLSCSLDFWRARYRRCAIRLASRGLRKPDEGSD